MDSVAEFLSAFINANKLGVWYGEGSVFSSAL